MNRDCCIPEHGFGSSGSDFDKSRSGFGVRGPGFLAFAPSPQPRTLNQWISNVIEFALRLLPRRLLIRERGLAARAPVDDVVAAVDQPLLVEPDEHLKDRLGEPFVHREARAAPVAGRAQPLELADRS